MPKPLRMMADDLEQQLLGEGLCSIAGVDEVGRGPLAGPVVAAAVIVGDAERDWLKAHVRDSKAMTAVQREAALAVILRSCKVGVAEASVAEIDSLNILQASLLAMQRAVAQLADCGGIMVDGNQKIRGITLPQHTVVGGDGRELAIACASVVAKQHRDGLMARLAADFPHYGWDSNAGYGTAAHLEGLRLHGVCEHHRRSFAPVKALVEAGYGAAA